MEKLREKISSLREEANVAHERADSLDATVKQLMDERTEREQEIISLQNRITRLEEEAEVRETQLDEAKEIQKNSVASLNESDVIMKKVDTLQEKYDELEIQLRESQKEAHRLDLENEKLNRIITQDEKDREDADKRYEELNEKYMSIKAELEETMKALDDI
ncbi:tropomyosin-2 [Coemansia sp. RSA 1813]|nr:tropomyosin-2 [Coemansia sp. RSA 1646]KAJ2091521.1 tropomyosin-2 [Coemansia sp. RSA 986]KAJ2215178.1 tropomyosin-2 [Coemansia sp. RSA 487]KAJ2572278.1 tropomyosin-2 [Coemansia sp. RSA 1813]